MRDDLHHCLPQTHRWRRVVHVACSPGLGGDLPEELARSVWGTLQELFCSPWGKDFKEVLTVSQGDLFGSGVESIQAKLAALDDQCTSPLARRIVEVATAQVTINGHCPNSLDIVTRATLEIAAQDGIEGAVAWVADQHGDAQARPLRMALTLALAKCNLNEPPLPKKRPQKLSVGEGLNVVLDLKDW